VSKLLHTFAPEIRNLCVISQRTAFALPSCFSFAYRFVQAAHVKRVNALSTRLRRWYRSLYNKLAELILRYPYLWVKRQLKGKLFIEGTILRNIVQSRVYSFWPPNPNRMKQENRSRSEAPTPTEPPCGAPPSGSIFPRLQPSPTILHRHLQKTGDED
jgi:hypothetical protein